ncbi:MAG: hypothetical protein H0Z34_04355 [Brevibacillus sp.]|nr:hypothetical protein [Brevibacillus sp.]
MGLLYETVMKIKDKKQAAANNRQLRSSLADMTLKQVVRAAGNRTAPLHLPGWLVK